VQKQTIGVFRNKYPYAFSPSSLGLQKRAIKKIPGSDIIIKKLPLPEKFKPNMEIPDYPPVIIFPPTHHLLWHVGIDGESQLSSYRLFIPPEFPLYIISYDPLLPPDHTSEGIAKDFKDFIEEVIQRPVILMALSYGGSVGIPFAGMFPELVIKLILVVCTYTVRGSGIELGNELLQLAKDGKPYTLEKRIGGLYRSKILSRLSNFKLWKDWPELEEVMNPLSTFINGYTHLLETPLTRKEYLPKITAPTLIIGGTHDQFSSVQDYQETRNLIPNAKLELFEGHTHTVPVEKIFGVRELIESFLKE